LGVGGRTTFIELLVFFQGAIGGSVSSKPEGSSGSESFELEFGICSPNLRATFFTGFFVALSNPVRRAVEAPITSYQLSRLGLDIF
jgi:hypothetical protein